MAYTTQTCFYRRIPTPTGSLIWTYGIVAFTPTFTTASGQLEITTNIPYSATSPSNGILQLAQTSGFTWGTGNTMIWAQLAGSSSILFFFGAGSGNTFSQINITNCTTNVAA